MFKKKKADDENQDCVPVTDTAQSEARLNRLFDAVAHCRKGGTMALTDIDDLLGLIDELRTSPVAPDPFVNPQP